MVKYRSIDKINLAFLGCGNITRQHAKTINKLKEGMNLSFASRSLDKAKMYQQNHRGNLAFGSYEAAIQSSEINVLMINTPPNTHWALAKAGLEAGKHVIVEKPPFLQASQMEELGCFADTNGLQLLIAENYYYKPLRKKLQEAIHSRWIGDPLFIQINATKKQESKDDWREDKALSGFGALFEGGIHWINFLNNIGFTIKNPKGFIPKQRTELERSIQVVAETQEGAILNLLYSWEVDTIFKGLRVSKVYGRAGSLTFETNGIFLFARGRRNKIVFPGLRDIQGFQSMFTDFFASLHKGHGPQFKWEMAQADLALIEEIYQTI